MFFVVEKTFALKYLEELIREFMEATDTTDFDYCAFVIQQVLKQYAIQASLNDPVWSKLSNTFRTNIESLLTSKYSVKKPKLPYLTCPIYLSDYGMTFESWISHWLLLMISYIDESEPEALNLFNNSKAYIPRSPRVSSFLLPYGACKISFISHANFILHGKWEAVLNTYIMNISCGYSVCNNLWDKRTEGNHCERDPISFRAMDSSRCIQSEFPSPSIGR